MDDEMKHLLEAMRQENAAMREENAAKHQETRRHFDVTVERIETRVDAKHEETRRHFDVAVERFESRFDLLAETVQHVNEELQRTRVSLTEKIEQSAAETQAMIKLHCR